MRKANVMLITMLMLLAFTIGFRIGLEFIKYGYKRGQIDYANGIIKYELKDQPDGSRVWKEKDNK